MQTLQEHYTLPSDHHEVPSNTMANNVPVNDLYGFADIVEASLDVSTETTTNMGIVDELEWAGALTLEYTCEDSNLRT